MVQFKKYNILIPFILFASIFLFACTDTKKNVTEPSETFDIVGTWESTYIEDWGPVHGGNSTWIFNSDSTYQWFLELHTRSENSAGDYSFNGDALTCEVFSILVGSNTVNITKGENTFSFVDVNDKRWTYTKVN